MTGSAPERLIHLLQRLMKRFLGKDVLAPDLFLAYTRNRLRMPSSYMLGSRLCGCSEACNSDTRLFDAAVAVYQLHRAAQGPMLQPRPEIPLERLYREAPKLPHY